MAKIIDKGNPDDIVYAQGQKWTRKKLQEYRDYQNEFNKETYQSFVFRCNKTTEASIIAQLKAQDNIAGYIKRLVAEDITKNNAEKENSAFIADELIKLSDLCKKEVISKEEFETLKTKLINLGNDNK